MALDQGAQPPALRIAHVVAGIDRAGSGVDEAVRRLCAAQARLGGEVRLLAVGAARTLTHDGYVTEVLPPDAPILPPLRALHASQALSRALGAAAAELDVIHAHGVWTMPNVYPARIAATSGAALVHSPHGMLAPEALRFSSGRKRVFAALWQRAALRHATCLHATCDAEADEIRAFGLGAPIAIIPNGVDIPDLPPAPPKAGRRTILYLGRLHPKKQIDTLIRAWARIEASAPEWDVRIVGPSELGYRDTLEKLVKDLGASRVTFQDGIFGAAKNQAFREAEVLVLPSLNENFGLVVAEALANATPVISTRGAPWRGLVDNDCGWWIDHGVDALAATLCEATQRPRPELEAMGKRGREWMKRAFAWDRIAADMLSVYRWTASSGPRPDFIHT